MEIENVGEAEMLINDLFNTLVTKLHEHYPQQDIKIMIGLSVPSCGEKSILVGQTNLDDIHLVQLSASVINEKKETRSLMLACMTKGLIEAEKEAMFNPLPEYDPSLSDIIRKARF